MRIVSLLPAATEIVCALGLRDSLVARSHECDYPEPVRELPAIVRPSLPLDGLTPAAIDAAVSERLRTHGSLYEIDEELLQTLEPDLIATQDLCQVCAPSGNELTAAVRTLTKKPEIIFLSPHTLDDIDANLREVGRATGTASRAEELIAAGRDRRDAIASTTRSIALRPRVFCMEWVDPIYCSGHWVPEMVELAGGVDTLGRRGTDSVRVSWNEVVAWAPEVLVVMPCGYGLDRAMSQVPQLFEEPGWSDLPAVRDGRVYAVDANAYFARPGPRVIDGIELLAHLFHPEHFDWTGAAGAFARIEMTIAGRSQA
jgi:iron complex transport system substrate-binding protein